MIAAAELVMVALSAVATMGVEPLDRNGVENRIVVAILGDGYTAAEQEKMSADARELVEHFRRTPPFDGYGGLFTFRLVHLLSAESGAGSGSPRDTALGSHFCWIDRLLCTDFGRALEAAIAAVPEHDVAMVLVNDGRYGGAGGSIPVVSASREAREIMLHELGHSLGGLADEYEDGGGPYPPCSVADDCGEPNVTLRTLREQIPWSAWIDPATPLPTPESASPSDVVGLFEGARYQPAGVHRPVARQCRMHELGQPFCPVCTEALVRRIWDAAAPIERATPELSQASVSACETVAFAVRLALPSDKLRVEWTLDGAPIRCGGTGVSFPPGALPAGSHELAVTVRDPTPAVRNDPAQRLVDRASWRVDVQECLGGRSGGEPPACTGAASLDVTLAGSGRGRVTSAAAGIDTRSSWSGAFETGTRLELVAVPESGSRFDGWSGSCEGPRSCTVTIDAANSVTATFTGGVDASGGGSAGRGGCHTARGASLGALAAALALWWRVSRARRGAPPPRGRR